MKLNRKFYINTIKYGLLTIAVIFICYFLFRNVIIRNIVSKRIVEFNIKHNAELKIEKISLTGLSSIEIDNISLKHKDRDTLLKAQKAIGSISFFRLIIGNVKFDDIQLINLTAKLYKDSLINNYSFLLTSKSNKVTTENVKLTYSEQAQKIINAVFDKFPDKIKLKKFNLFVNINKDRFSFYIPEFIINNSSFKSNIYLTDNNNPDLCIVEGIINRNQRLSLFKLYSNNHNKVKLPYFNQTLKAKVEFDTLQFSLSNHDNNNITVIKGIASFDNLNIFHVKIASKDVNLKKLKIDYTINIGDNYFELDSATNVAFNKLNFNPYIKYKTKPVKQISLKLKKDDFLAQDLFESLPVGLFNNFEGIKTSGKLSYNLNFYIDFSQLDSLIFESNITKDKFRIDKYGKTDLGFFNQPFSYTAYEKGVAVRTFDVSPDNPNFRRIDEIPIYLRGAILTSEDGIFYYHNGFLIDALKRAIAEDIRAKAFVRGGSTISMQLVKNLFLTRNKSIARKLEEVLIVWLIESNYMSSKDRMFEVYLNIIEMGPMVYGVNEASYFYFNKPVNKITLAESIFLASIIPHPKWFKYEFNEDGSLRDYMVNYYADVSKKMMDKGYISQEEYEKLTPNVDIKGNAKLNIIKTDSVPAKSLMLYERDL